MATLAKYAIDSDVYQEIGTPKPEEPGKLKVVAALSAAGNHISPPVLRGTPANQPK